MNDPSPLMMSRSYGLWPPPVTAGDDSSNSFPNPNRPLSFAAAVVPKYPRPHWKPNSKRPPSGSDTATGVAGPSFMPPPPLDHSDAPQLNHQARGGRPPRRFYKKKPNNHIQHHTPAVAARFAPFAPRNTTSYLIRAKRAGGITSLVSPCPVTPAVLPTPEFSPSREALVDTAKEEWGVDGYGSMKGLIRLRSPRTPTGCAVPGAPDADEEEAAAAVAVEEGSSESDVEEHVEVERRLDHDLSRFEMLYFPPTFADHDVEADNDDGFRWGGAMPRHPHGHARAHAASFVLGNHVDGHDAHILRLEEENLTLRDRLFLMERDMADMRRRLSMLEMECRRGGAGDGNSHNNKNNDKNKNSNNHNINNGNTSSVEEMSDTEEAGGACSEKSVGD